jgi:hypothetical protein
MNAAFLFFAVQHCLARLGDYDAGEMFLKNSGPLADPDWRSAAG